jgi:N-acyl-D-glutamate deacylase
MRKLILFLFLLWLTALRPPRVLAQRFDLVLEGGRVIDPETGMDAVRNVGIRDGKIVRISTEALSGRRVVQAAGLVVAPGFIDLHQHAQDLASQRVKALDGVTTALELGLRLIAPRRPNRSRPCKPACAVSWTLAAWPWGWVFSTRPEQLVWR